MRNLLVVCLLLHNGAVSISDAFLLHHQSQTGRLSQPVPQYMALLKETNSFPTRTRTNEKNIQNNNDVNIQQKKRYHHRCRRQRRHPIPSSLSLETFTEKCQSMLDLNSDGKVDIDDLYVITDALGKKCQSMLDLNNDGKIDIEDLRVILDVLDVNGDGKIDAEDARAALSIAALTTVLLSPLPAHAKGGGHGGGSHGHWDSRGSRSTRIRKSGNGGRGEYSDYPRFARPSYHYTLKDFNPNICHRLPDEGEVISVTSEKQTGVYIPGTVTKINKSNCEFTVDRDGEQLVIFTHKNQENYIAVTITGGMYYYFYGRNFLNKFKFNREFDNLKDPRPGHVSCPPPPLTGNYSGTATEWKGPFRSTQSVQSTFTFTDDGEIRGFGYDSIDGNYEIEGAWKEKIVQEEERDGVDIQGCERNHVYILRWVERYSDFDVTVQGRMQDNENKITGTFYSSLDVQGTVELDFQSHHEDIF